MLLKLIPTNAPSTPTQTAPFTKLLHGTTGYGSKIDYLACSSLDNIVAGAIAKEDVAIANNIATFTLSNQVSNLVEVEIGSAYSLAADKNNPQLGEFTFDYELKEVKVYLVEGDSIERSPVVYRAGFTTVESKSNCLDLPVEPLLLRWNATNLKPIQFGFGSEPEGFGFEFLACVKDEASIKSALDNDTQHNCFGYSWVVNKLLIEKRELTKQLKVTVDFVYYLASHGKPSKSPLDKNIALRKSSGNNYSRSRSVGEIATLADTNYVGDAIAVRTGRSTSSNDFTTVRQLIEERAINNHGFVFYGKQGFEVRSWRHTRTHVLNKCDVINTPVFSYNGHGNYYNGVRLAEEYRNKKVSLEFEEDSKSEVEGVTEEWVFENCNSFATLYTPAQVDANGVLRSPTADILRSPGINFDNGGVFGKSGTKITRVNGIPVFEIKTEVDYAFSSDEIYEIEVTAQNNYTIKLDSFANPQDYFKEVKKTVCDWRFDSEGYLISKILTGFQLARVDQETDKLEAITALGRLETTGEAQWEAIAASYQFNKKMPILETVFYSLALHKDYYDDVVRKDNCDDEFVDPKFMRRKRQFRQDGFISQNPRNQVNFTYPPIQSAKYVNSTTETSLVSTNSPEKYEIRETKTTSEGTYLKNSQSESSTDYRDGRPGNHTRIDLRFDFNNPPSNSNYDRYKNQSYYINSVGVEGAGRFNEGSIGFSDVDNPSTVLAIARTQLSINNSRASLTTSVDTFWRDDVEVGDFLMYEGLRWKIFNKYFQPELLKDKKLKCKKFTLDLGFFLDSELTLSNRSQKC